MQISNCPKRSCLLSRTSKSENEWLAPTLSAAFHLKGATCTSSTLFCLAATLRCLGFSGALLARSKSQGGGSQ
eukprot:1218178-Amphidinium_carterae.1